MVNCLDCTGDGHRDRPAVGTCRHCGAGVCADHVVVVEDRLTRIELLNRVVAVEPPARRLRCHRCHTAHEAATPRGVGRRAARARQEPTVGK